MNFETQVPNGGLQARGGW